MFLALKNTKLPKAGTLPKNEREKIELHPGRAELGTPIFWGFYRVKNGK